MRLGRWAARWRRRFSRFGAGQRRWFGTRSRERRDADRGRGARSARRVVAAPRAAKHSPRLGAGGSTIRFAEFDVESSRGA